MAAFKTIFARAAKRAGGADALEPLLPVPKGAQELAALPDDRYLSLMSRRVFSAGLKHSMVMAKWPAFEEVFMAFDPRRIVSMSDEDLEALMGERRIIRHWGKIRAVRDNAAAIHRLASDAGGLGRHLAGWPGERIMDLWADLAARFQQMGGNSGPYFLRMAGKDTFLLSGDVVQALIDAKVVKRKPATKAERADVQAAFNAWAQESDRPLCQISMVLARSVG